VGHLALELVVELDRERDQYLGKKCGQGCMGAMPRIIG